MISPAPIHVTFRCLSPDTIDLVLDLDPAAYRMSDRAREYVLTQCEAQLIPYIGAAIVLIHGRPDLTVQSCLVDAYLQQAQREGWLQYHKHTQTWGVYL